MNFLRLFFCLTLLSTHSVFAVNFDISDEGIEDIISFVTESEILYSETSAIPGSLKLIKQMYAVADNKKCYLDTFEKHFLNPAISEDSDSLKCQSIKRVINMGADQINSVQEFQDLFTLVQSVSVESEGDSAIGCVSLESSFVAFYKDLRDNNNMCKTSAF